MFLVRLLSTPPISFRLMLLSPQISMVRVPVCSRQLVSPVAWICCRDGYAEVNSPSTSGLGK